MSQTITFYRERDEPYGCFSNFSKHGFELGGKFWATVEHYFQAMKFVGTPHEDAARTCENADGRRNRSATTEPAHCASDWERIKDDVMREAVRAKLEQNADIRKILLATGDAQLIEDAPNDYYWGWGEKHTGKNMLGIILMESRDILCAWEPS